MSELSIKLPATEGGSVESYSLCGEPIPVTKRPAPSSRKVLAAAHVVSDPLANNHPDSEPVIDWPATMAFRHHLVDQGLGIAEAMDTAQRGMGLDWINALELATRTCSEFGLDPAVPIFVGAGTDQLVAGEARSLDEVTDAYLYQVEKLQGVGARLIFMASAELARLATKPEDYASVYAKVLSACDKPVILHWLGEMFAPSLAGYWGAAELDAATDSCLAIINEHEAKIDGIKLSLLNKDRELDMRKRLPEGVRMYTGDDFNYPELICGDGEFHSDALLGILDPIAPAASAALEALDNNETERFFALLDPTIELARLMFSAPTYHYKVGVVFLAWLNGHQEHFALLGGVQGMRSIVHLANLFRLADKSGLLCDPDLATKRMTTLMSVHGIS